MGPEATYDESSGTAPGARERLKTKHPQGTRGGTTGKGGRVPAPPTPGAAF